MNAPSSPLSIDKSFSNISNEFTSSLTRGSAPPFFFGLFFSDFLSKFLSDFSVVEEVEVEVAVELAACVENFFNFKFYGFICINNTRNGFELPLFQNFFFKIIK